MENFEQGESRTQLLKDLISRAPQRIEDEFGRTANTWLECFGSTIFQVETFLDMNKLKDELGDKKHSKAIEKLEQLKERHYELKQKYSKKDTMPDDKIKKELLELLNELI